MSDWGEFRTRVHQDVSLIEVARRLGVTLVQPGNHKALARCPFHDDKRPSLSIDRRQDGWVWFCHACALGGDVFSFVQRRLGGRDFLFVARWLADQFGIPVPARRGRDDERTRPAREEVLDTYRASDRAAPERLDRWAASRAFEPAFLRQRDVYGVPRGTLKNWLASEADLDAVRVQEFIDAGLLAALTTPEASLHPTASANVRDWLADDRIVFAVRDHHGKLVGFSGRAVTDGIAPKYKHTRGLAKSSVLYRLDHVRSQLETKNSFPDALFHVFVVEGFTDALRLEQRGLNAVAILGATLSAAQRDLLVDLAKDVTRQNRQLVVHLFLDADEAGLVGMQRAAAALLMRAARDRFLLDVISPVAETEQKSAGLLKDPDLLVRNLDDVSAAELLRSWSIPSLQLMLASALGVAPQALPSVWNELRDSQSMRLLHRAMGTLERALGSAEEAQVVVARSLPFWCWRDDPAISTETWVADLAEYLRQSPSTTATPPAPTTSLPSESQVDPLALHRAIALAQASTQRREFPIDTGAWERIKVAGPVFKLAFAKALERDSRPVWPFIAVSLRKSADQERLKAGPVPEDLVLQQYMLDELLQEYGRGTFAMSIPAVRWSRNATTEPRTTGRPEGAASLECVSFGYQVDQDVVDGLLPAWDEGIFRRYDGCWNEFLNFLARRARALEGPELYATRLDIRAFYDSVRRQDVVNALVGRLRRALEALPPATVCAPLFRPDVREPAARARAIVDWFCDQSFGYRYLDPVDGTIDRAPSGRGLPQGPDLSAWLANIVLFDLDERLRIEVELQDQDARSSGAARPGRHVTGAAYARYVDDIIVFSRNRAGLTRLRDLVELKLSEIGLDLSPKVEPVPRMLPEEFARWLVAERGIGGLRSGPFGRAVPVVPFSPSITLEDAGGMDRSQALALLHDPALDDPAVKSEVVLGLVERALLAHDLRHHDLAVAARAIWRTAIQRTQAGAFGEASSTAPHAQAARLFLDEWRKHEVEEGTLSELERRVQACQEASPLVVALSGADRYLARRLDLNPVFDSKRRLAVAGWRNALARVVLDEGVVASLLTLDRGGTGRPQLAFQITLQFIALAQTALATLAPEERNGAFRLMEFCRALPGGQSNFRDFKPDAQEAIVRALYSIAELVPACALEILEERAEFRPFNDWGYLHRSIARLRCSATQSLDSTGVDPLAQALEPSAAVHVQSSEGTPKVIAEVLELWRLEEPGLSSSPKESASRELKRAALEALVNAARARALPLLARRKWLLDWLAPTGSELSLVHLGTWAEHPALLLAGSVEEHLALHLVSYSANAPPSGVDSSAPGFHDRYKFVPVVTKETSSVASGLTVWQGDVPGVAPAPPNRLPATPQLLAWLGGFFQKVLDDSVVDAVRPGTQVIVHALSFFRSNGSLNGLPELVCGELVDARRATGFALIRDRRGSLLPIQIAVCGERIWRLGVAVSDWLGRPATPRSWSELRLAPSHADLAGADDPVLEATLRQALHRLCGRFWNRTEVLPARQVPRPVTSLLHRLKHYPSNPDSEQALAFLVSTAFWNRAWRVVLTEDASSFRSTHGTDLLVSMAGQCLFSDDELLHRLPAAESGSTFATRRGTLAWLNLASRIEALRRRIAVVDHQVETSNELEPLVAACHLAAVRTELRCSTLELVAVLRARGLKSGESRTDPPQGRSAETEPKRTVQQTEESYSSRRATKDDEAGVPFVAAALWRLVSDETFGGEPDFSIVDWATAFGAITALIESDAPRIGLDFGARQESDVLRQHEALREAYGALLDTLFTYGDSDGDGSSPFRGMQPTIQRWKEPAFALAQIQHLACVQQLAGLTVTVPPADPFFEIRADSTSRGAFIVRTFAEGTRVLQPWQVDVQKLLLERTEYEGYRDNLEYKRCWTETLHEGRVVGVSVVGAGLARLAALLPAQSAPVVASSPETLNAAPPAGDSAPDPAEPAREVPLRVDGAVAAASTSEVQPMSNSELNEWLGWRNASWEHRSKEPRSTDIRVGLLQWRAGNSYCLPDKDPDLSVWAPESEDKWIQARRCEYRRRRILAEVLSACRQFGVDALVIPEYSLRFDTVRWLIEEHSGRAPGTTIWAGTFLMFPGGPWDPRFGEAPRPREAVLSSLPAPARRSRLSPGEALPPAIRWRGKLYPALGLNELILPGSKLLNPLWHDARHPDLPEASIVELICAEAFIVSNPANWNAYAEEVRRLRVRFGQGSGVLSYSKALEDVKTALEGFASVTGIRASRFPRRILLVPAATTRTSDYHVIGQAGYLASGITTVFCNSIIPQLGVWGGSCFIGNDGGPQLKDTIPTQGPYHGAEPGLLRRGELSGPLAGNEQALVIADVDVVSPLAGKPRPQALPPPLRLVAHLPILESRNNQTQSWLPALHRAVRDLSKGTSKSGVPRLKDVRALTQALEQLAKAEAAAASSGRIPAPRETRPRGLASRAEAWSNRYLVDPVSGTPPVAVDWIWVELKEADAGTLPTMDFPPLDGTLDANDLAGTAPDEGGPSDGPNAAEHADHALGGRTTRPDHGVTPAEGPVVEPADDKSRRRAPTRNAGTGPPAVRKPRAPRKKS